MAHEPRSRQDVIEFLIEQHRQIRQLFDNVRTASGTDREAAFGELRRLLAVHETAEEEIVHPRARRELVDGDIVVDHRLQEERVAKHLLVDLEHIDTQSAEFIEKFAELEATVLAHAENEERDEFPRLTEELDPAQLRRMATAARLAESVAPTRPHPSVELRGEHILVGPFAAMLDRARDAIRTGSGARS
jgi:hemerythrin superfamily protein